MKLVQTIKELQSELDALRSEGKTIGITQCQQSAAGQEIPE